MVKSAALPIAFKRHLLPAFATFLAVLGGAAAYWRTTPPLYATSSRLMIDDRSVSLSEIGQTLSALPNNIAGGINPIATQAELVKSQRVLRRAIARVVADRPAAADQPNLTPASVGKALKIDIIPATNILELTYQGSDPQISADLLNAIADAMIEENAEAVRNQASSVRKFLEIKVPQQQERLAEAEVAENRYRQQTGIVAIEAQTESLVSSLSAVDDQARSLAAQVQEARTKDQMLQQVTGMDSLDRAYVSLRAGQDEALRDLRLQLAAAETTVIEARSRLGDQNPELLALQEQRDAARQRYSDRLAQVIGGSSLPAGGEATDEATGNLLTQYIAGEIERNALENKLQLVQAERQQLQARLSQLPLQQQPLAALVRRRQEAEASLKLLQGKLEEARIAEAQLVSNIKIIDQAAVPTVVAVPKLPVILAIGAVFGGILATSVVVLLELLDDRIHDASELEALLKLPLLGKLPKLPPSIPVGAIDQFLSTPEFVEPYRAILKSAEFIHQRSIKTIVVSSVHLGEGKSIVASHLAAVSALLSWRTLAIDLDVRQPIQHHCLTAAAYPGITDVIEGHKSLKEAIQSTPVLGLELLAQGQALVHPAALSESNALRKLLADLTDRYDLLVLDAQPTSLGGDAVSLSQQTDGLILVVRPNFSRRSALVRSVADLKKSGAQILGIVATETPDPASSDWHLGPDPMPKLLKYFPPQAPAEPRSNVIRY